MFSNHIRMQYACQTSWHELGDQNTKMVTYLTRSVYNYDVIRERSFLNSVRSLSFDKQRAIKALKYGFNASAFFLRCSGMVMSYLTLFFFEFIQISPFMQFNCFCIRIIYKIICINATLFMGTILNIKGGLYWIRKGSNGTTPLPPSREETKLLNA